MVININPRRINVPGGAPGRTADRQTQDNAPVIAPTRAHVNHIPSTESLSTLIRSGIEALRRGIRWDRGSILNLLV